MDRELAKLSLKRITADRPFLFLMVSLASVGLIYCLAVAFNIHQSDVTVYSRYTAFGVAHFYKSHWQYLISFVAFGLIVTLGHLGLMVKLHGIERRWAAVAAGWVGIAILLIAFVYTFAVMTLGRAA